ncbi:Hint domain-containing protein [Nocardia sp. XZ_19_369]|uniref:Gp37-like protein n=1 Tax=Nocardia sp. XZ_19_369 TaxID=2769487 RepID=UPI00188F2047|nr:Hint domain-containing protein [Nocardia sp. XZ_19_369]
MSTSVETIDFERVFDDIVARLKRDTDRRILPPLMRIWDGNWVLRGEIHNEISAKFSAIENDTGIGTVELPATYYLARWMTDHNGRSTKNIFITVDRDGARWSGMLDDLEQDRDEHGQRIIRATFKHDTEHLRHITAYCNPFTPPEFQFPKTWACVSGETLVQVCEGDRVVLRPIRELAGRPCQVVVDGRIHHSPTGSWSNGIKAVYRLTTATGKSIELTGDHKVLTPDGFVPAQDIGVGGWVMADHQVREQVTAFEYGGETEVFDIAVSDVHRFVANGVVVHNCFGPARWSLLLTLFLNLLRLEGRLWTLPVGDPLDPRSWLNLDTSTWSQVVKPLSILDDRSQFAVVHSRFKSMYEVSQRIVADAQLTWEPRRWLTGDPPPWPGARVRHGALVWDLVDSSGWDTETSFAGNLFDGLVRAVTRIGADGMVETIEEIRDPTFPEEYSRPRWKGTIPRAPGIILRDGDRTGVLSTNFHWRPATDVGFITGGHSAPGINEMLGAAVNLLGDLVSLSLAIPPLGGVASEILKPLFTDVFGAFQKRGDPARERSLGWSHYHETFCAGADRAYTLNALIALRTGRWRTREQTTHSVKVLDGYDNLRIGQNGHGNAWLGTRIGTTVRDWGKPGAVYVDRITEIVLAWDRSTTPTWDITVGAREPDDPLLKGLEMLDELAGLARDLGVL